MKCSTCLVFLAASLVCIRATAQQADLRSSSVVQTVVKLRPGQYVWAPEVAPGGPMLLVVNLTTQRAVLFRNGVPIGATTVSTGRPGYRTPKGAFTILQKHVEHYSSKYDNAPMPFMQRLTWYGVALHAGQLPGYPASHGCIRLPAGFAKLLYGVTRLGMTVVITDRAVTPRVAPTPEIVLNPAPAATVPAEAVDWHPERSADGPVSIVVSATDRQAIVLRNGMVIGSGPVSVDGPVSGTWVYTLLSVDAAGQHWTRLELSAPAEHGKQVAAQEWQRFHAPETFRRAVAAILEPGTTVIVTPDSVKPGGNPISIIEEEAPAKN
jgi:L,D-transpeptidase catalytic domain